MILSDNHLQQGLLTQYLSPNTSTFQNIISILIMSVEDNAPTIRPTGPIDRFFVNMVTGLNSKEVHCVLNYSNKPELSINLLPDSRKQLASIEAEADKMAQHGDFEVAHQL